MRAWNHLYRFDHQINGNHSWSVRWLGEWSPQTGQTNNQAVTPEGRQREWDLDQHTNVALNSVLGRNIVNQFRFGWTREDDRFAQNDFSACPSGGFDACSDQNFLEQQNVGANISYLTFLDGPRNVGTHWITNSPEISETLSWFVPDKKGDHDLKFGTKYYFTDVDVPEPCPDQRAVRDPVQRPLQRRRPADLSRSGSPSRCRRTTG